MSPDQEQQLLRIGKDVAKKCRLEDKEEAFSIALLGIAKGLKTYVPSKKVKMTTYLYQCAQFEVWAEWRRLHRIKRGGGVEPLSLEELEEEGYQI